MGLSAEVTLRKLGLGSQDATTGWYEKYYDESTINMIIYPRGAHFSYQGVGVYAREDAMGLTADVVEPYDQILTQAGKYYEVKTVQEWPLLDSFLFRECQMAELHLSTLSYENLTPDVNDARYNTKTYWEAYISSVKLNEHPYIVCYADADYPLIKVFKTKGIHIVFAVDEPNSTPLIGSSPSPSGYEEHVPTDVYALDTKLMHLGGAELRRVVETYPHGSRRALETMTPNQTRLGSETLYSRRHILKYRRGTT